MEAVSAPTLQSGNNEFSYITYKERENIPLKLFYEMVAKGLLNEGKKWRSPWVETYHRGSFSIYNLGNRAHEIYKSLLAES